MPTFPPLAIAATGACTPIGTRAWQTASLLQAGLSSFTRLALPGYAGLRATVSRVESIEPSCTGIDRLLRLAAPALFEALREGASPAWPLRRPIALFLAMPHAPGDGPAAIDPQRLALELPRALDVAAELLPLTVFAGGAAAGAAALLAAHRFMHQNLDAAEVLVGGVDSLCDLPSVLRLQQQRLLKVAGYSDGLVASEGAAFVRLARTATPPLALAVYPPVIAHEDKSRMASEDLLPGHALIDASQTALDVAGFTADGLGGYWCDADGSPWRGRELASLGAAMADQGGLPEATLPAASLGDVGAAWVPLLLSLSHERRQAYHHPLSPVPADALAGVCALQTVSGHDTSVAAWVTAWTRVGDGRAMAPQSN